MTEKTPTPLENIVRSLEALIICMVAAMALTVVWVML
jgi:hypothetical protein